MLSSNYFPNLKKYVGDSAYWTVNSGQDINIIRAKTRTSFEQVPVKNS